ncbi:hypothetical protein WJX81_007591 [Elliptochloris bilobata]|uniref:Uncharacterized protein n=1 Tax=Elliptochloris bilobata TaxID=381761 RepID=A0AAW1S787_9CHLO
MFAAINEGGADSVQLAPTGETIEAAEARIAASYENALQLLQAQDTGAAKAALDALLKEPLLATPAKGGWPALPAQVRFLALKNLAALLAVDDATAPRALRLYAEALRLDAGDVVLWHRLGTLAAEMGQWGLARAVFEHGLRRSPRHTLMAECLAEVLLQLGDYYAAAVATAHLLRLDACHPRARQLAAFLAAHGAELPEAARRSLPGRTQGAAPSAACDEALLRPRFRRREKRTEEGSEEEALGTLRNVPELLLPLLGPLPTPEPHNHERIAAASAGAGSAVTPGAELADEACEAAEVRAFLAGGAAGGSLHGLAAALVSHLTSAGRSLAPAAAAALLELEQYLREWPRLATAALRLAELHLEAGLRAGEAPALPRSPGAASPSGRSKLNQAVDVGHLRACAANLGLVRVASLVPAAGARAQPEGGPSEDAPATEVRVLSAGGGVESVITASQAAARLEALRLNALLEGGRAVLEEGPEAAAGLAGRLAPALLGEGPSLARSLAGDRRAFLQALALLQDAAEAAGDGHMETELRARVLRLREKLPCARPNPDHDPSPEHPVAEVEEAGAAREAVDGALAQCLYALYGVDLPHRDADWGDDLLGDEMTRAALSTAEDCREAWRHLRPYAEGVQDDPRRLARLQGALEAVRRQFPQPPPAVLAAWHPDALLEADALDEIALLEVPRPAAALVALAPPPELQAAVDEDGERDVHRALHGLLLRLVPDADFGPDEDLIGPDGHAAVEPAVRPALYDLRYNPVRYSTWDWLAGTLRDAAEALLEAAAKRLPASAWAADASLRARAGAWRQRARRAALVARQLAPTADDAASQDEALAMLDMGPLQGLPPAYDQRCRVPVRGGAYMAQCERAAAAVARAAAVLPDEWAFELWAGKLSARTGAPLGAVLRRYAHACHLAAAHAGGMLEPLYRLHASRLKALRSEAAPLADLARYCFTAEHAEALAALSLVNGVASAEAQAIIAEDCKEALHFCLERDRGFHRARFALSMADEGAGDVEAAAERLRPLFTSRTRAFSIAMQPITSLKAGRVPGSERGARGGAGSPMAGEDEATWGRRPAKVAGAGLTEGTRKYMACLRKYLLAYLRLLGALGDLDTLQAASAYLRTPREWAWLCHIDCVADLARLALGGYVGVLVRQLQAQLGGAAPAEPATPGDSSNPGRTPQAVPSLDDLQRAAERDEVARLLEKAYQVFPEHSALAEGGNSGEAWQRLSSAVDEAAPAEARAAWAAWGSEAAFGAFAQAHLAHLEVHADAERLQALAANLKRAWGRSLRQAPERVKRLAWSIAAATAGALGRCADQLEALAAAETPAAAPAGRAGPSAAATPFMPALRPREAPAAAALPDEEAARVEAGFQLLRQCHTLHKAWPPAPAGAPAPASADALLLRAFWLYMRLAHGPAAEGAPVTLAYAAAACDDLFRPPMRRGAAPAAAGYSLKRAHGPLNAQTQGKLLYWESPPAFINGEPAVNDGSIYSFDVLDKLLQQSFQTFTKLSTVTVTGHSAGAQALQRWAGATKVVTNNGSPIQIILNNPGTYLYLNSERLSAATLAALNTT